MPLITVDDYKPPFLLKNGHIATIYPHLFRSIPAVNYQREKFTTSDDDFIMLDWVKNKSKRLVILCHGLEGNSKSQYVKNLASIFDQNKWDVCAMNYRGCAGGMNLKVQMYHSGFTRDLHDVILHKTDDYDEVYLVGVSLGGNMVIKYVSDQIFHISSKVKSAVGISVPLDLSTASREIARLRNKIYDYKFLITLKDKMRKKHNQFPDAIPIHNLSKVKNLVDFDNYFTAPIHGFADGEDYYAQCHSGQFLHQSAVPTLIINALNDPFLSKECYPTEKIKKIKNVYFMCPKFGGHVGFTNFGANNYWNEKKTFSFIDDQDDFLRIHHTNFA